MTAPPRVPWPGEVARTTAAHGAATNADSLIAGLRANPPRNRRDIAQGGDLVGSRVAGERGVARGRAVAREREATRERGATTIELALYMPILLLAIFVTVQFSLMYLGDRAAQATAREAARVARVGGGTGTALADARAQGMTFAASIGRGVLFNPSVVVVPVGAGQIRATVTGDALTLVPGVRLGRITATVQGPIEAFRADTAGP